MFYNHDIAKGAIFFNNKAQIKGLMKPVGYRVLAT